jgi:hypothetical protein
VWYVVLAVESDFEAAPAGEEYVQAWPGGDGVMGPRLQTPTHGHADGDGDGDGDDASDAALRASGQRCPDAAMATRRTLSHDCTHMLCIKLFWRQH